MEHEEGWRSMAIELAETSRAFDLACRRAWRGGSTFAEMAQAETARQAWDAALLRHDMMISQERAEKEESR